jgi:BirA family transcriptional regulator, biotin operon repressor / biotin---[acetyl-CoA-carboxylase] ligase
MTFGNPHRHFRVTDSTNARARELAEQGAPGGTVVTAAQQTEGRGRQGRSWVAPAGGALLYSAILRPLDQRHLMLPLAVPLAVCGAAEELEPGIECGIKWPNDIWIDGRKLAGVLIEAKPQEGWAVIGVGLNTAVEPTELPPDLQQTAASLDGVAAEAARRSLDRHLARWVAADTDAILAGWSERDALRGREIAWEDGSGIADGVDDRGCLLVLLPGGGRSVLGAGEVHLRL